MFSYFDTCPNSMECPLHPSHQRFGCLAEEMCTLVAQDFDGCTEPQHSARAVCFCRVSAEVKGEDCALHCPKRLLEGD